MVRFMWSTASTYWSMRKAICVILAGLISIGSPAMAGGPVEIRSTDITLGPHGLLKGSVLNASAQPVSGVTVHVLHGETVVASATSDGQGQFSVKSLHNGSHIMQVGRLQQPVRFWGTEAAPPVSTSQITIIVDEEVIRGQSGFETGNSVADSMNTNLGVILLIGGAVGIVLGTTLSADNDSPAPPASA